MAPTILNIKNLFDHKRISNQWDLIPVIVYFPLGFCFFIIRVFVGLHAFIAASLLPKGSPMRCVVLRSMCTILGFVVRETNMEAKRKGRLKVLVSNHVTNFDHLAVDLVYPCIVPSVWDLPKVLNWTLGFHDFGVKDGREALISNVRTHLAEPDSTPILTHPEGATTNARTGLLKFSSWPFTLDTVVQPICISVNRPTPFRIHHSVIGSRWWSDLFWILLTPCTIFTLKYLDPITRNEQEDVEEYTKRVQREMAQSMGVVVTNFTDADKVEYAKRLLHERQAASTSSGQDSRMQSPTSSSSAGGARTSTSSFSSPSVPPSPQIAEMARRVKEVLPQVPLATIQKDVAITANVDESITRFLDGSVIYITEPASSSSSATRKSSDGDASPSMTNPSPLNSTKMAESAPLFMNTAAKSFGRTANDRMKSYKERKSLMVKAARNRYVRVHGLDENLIWD